MKRGRVAAWRLVIGILVLIALTACATNTTTNPQSSSISPEPTPDQVTRASGTVTGMKLSFDESGKPIVLYSVKLDNGTEVSARTPYREAGTTKSDDKGKRVELESLTGADAKSAMADWRIISVPE